MKHLIKLFVFHVFALWLVSQIFGGFVVDGSWSLFFFAGFILTILMLFVAPMLRILFIPINFLTFGLLSWVVNVLVLYILTFVVPEVFARPWVVPGTTWQGFVVPPIQLTYFVSLTIASLSMTLLTKFLDDITQ